MSASESEVHHGADLTPEEVDELKRDFAGAGKGAGVPVEDVLAGFRRERSVVLDEDEEEELARRIDEIPELDRQGLLRPIAELFAEVRAEIRQRAAG